MTGKLLSAFTVTGLLALFIALPRYYFTASPACVEDAAFSGLGYGTPEYRAAAVEILSHSQPQDFRYFFKTFSAEGADTYMVVNLRSKAHCFDVPVLVERWDKLDGMRKTNGRSYPKELYGLKWSLQERGGRQTVVYEDMRAIID